MKIAFIGYGKVGAPLADHLQRLGHQVTLATGDISAMIAQLGWEPLDVGGLEQALHLEHMTLLWVRMVRVNGATPHMVWAALRR